MMGLWHWFTTAPLHEVLAPFCFAGAVWAFSYMVYDARRKVRAVRRPLPAAERGRLILHTTVTSEQVELLQEVFAKRTERGWEIPAWVSLLEVAAFSGEMSFYWPPRPWGLKSISTDGRQT